MTSNRKAAIHEPPRIPDEFTLRFKRAPGGGWVVSGDSAGKGHYAYEAFCDAFCRLPMRGVSGASLPSTGTDAKARRNTKGGGR
ncbi:hypothetical protein D7V80_32765 [Corallococcus sp. CA054B]|uniref:hypothetical protein n=1 Tax=Corallococcus sp. CA054B TaxID=2316734 RepID=UPI000EA3A84D|nr:hypothetical protein [Corallococcus sp. CA054B]RKG62901.1 hypothetical protein D7V80_32765 [Corallococcus sp. CA054B]